MDGLPNTMAAIPAGQTRRTYGTAYWDGTKWFAEINGNLLTARWLDPMQPAQGGKIVVDITGEGNGLCSALVIGGYTDQPRPSTGTVSAVGVTELLVLGADSGGYTTDRFLGPITGYSVGNPVYLTWDASKPTVMGVVAGIAAPREQDPPPAAGSSSTTGYVVVPATASDTWGVGGWGRWATSRPTWQDPGEDVYSGSWGGYTMTGAWFYGAPAPVLSGKTITKIQFRLSGRLNVGASGPATVHLFAHTSQSRPDTDVTRVAGPFDITVDQGAGPSWHELPLSFAAALQAGGGISIAGEPYAGFNSRLDDPESGKLILDWRA